MEGRGRERTDPADRLGCVKGEGDFDFLRVCFCNFQFGIFFDYISGSQHTVKTKIWGVFLIN